MRGIALTIETGQIMLGCSSGYVLSGLAAPLCATTWTIAAFGRNELPVVQCSWSMAVPVGMLTAFLKGKNVQGRWLK
jgi:hypothetical protein